MFCWVRLANACHVPQNVDSHAVFLFIADVCEENDWKTNKMWFSRCKKLNSDTYHHIFFSLYILLARRIRAEVLYIFTSFVIFAFFFILKNSSFTYSYACSEYGRIFADDVWHQSEILLRLFEQTIEVKRWVRFMDDVVGAECWRKQNTKNTETLHMNRDKKPSCYEEIALLPITAYHEYIFDCYNKLNL